MPKYALRPHEATEDRRDELLRAIAETVLREDDRPVATIRVEALPGLEHRAGFRRLRDDVGLEYENEYLEATFGATPDRTRAVLDLFSTSLIRAIFYDADGNEIFARYEHSSALVRTDEETFDRIEAALTDEQRDLIADPAE